ncbi:conserved hypothetical protein [Azorhizobium caulinodans ORS 571]|uniref:Cyanovirin-N domain-containing protein n=2 Tax=Xanthobacteraceae TaxID=335928 RepID=A8IES4_AZOC5|nr:conserved hypothetical protein [Azorhizobium caulinodans ORS 571]
MPLFTLKKQSVQTALYRPAKTHLPQLNVGIAWRIHHFVEKFRSSLLTRGRLNRRIGAARRSWRLGMSLRRFALLVLGGLSLSVAAPQIAAAQSVPSGPYLRSCNDVRVSRGVDLVAMCRARNGEWFPTRLPNFLSCVSAIQNLDGNLACERGRGGGGGWNGGGGGWNGGGGGYAPPPPPPPRNNLPPGSYRASCQVQDFSGGWLRASCNNGRNQWRNTQLYVPGCKGDIGNMGGNLVCNR